MIIYIIFYKLIKIENFLTNHILYHLLIMIIGGYLQLVLNDKELDNSNT